MQKILLNIDEIRLMRLDQYRIELFKQEGGKIPNRSEAIRRLIDEALARKGKKGKK